MCGIVGARDDWLRSSGLDPDAAMRSALHELRWRGPDGEGLQHAGSWWLGCARLAISGPRRPQPVARRGGRFVGVMNGAVTNARELWARFAPGIEQRPAPPNDAWLPLLAVEHGDHDALAELRGHHAYAVVDTVEDRVHLGQDRYGEKPLHCVVARIGDVWRLVAFASTPAALRCLGVPVRDAGRHVAQWFRFGWSEGTTRRIDARMHVRDLPLRGVPFVAAADGTRWARPALEPRPATVRGVDTRDAELRERLANSVRRCLDSPSPAGLFLSGGVDSSCLALTLGRLGETIPAYQFRAHGTPGDERAAAEDVARAARLPLHEIDGGPELLDALPMLTRMAGQPLGDPSILAAHAVARAAAAQGVRILLGGEGADELLLGYRRYRALAHMPRWSRLSALSRLAGAWSMHKAARYWRAATAANPIRALLAVTPPAFGQKVLCSELGSHRCWRDDEATEPNPKDLALAGRDDDLANYLPRDLLPKIDVALMAAGVEGRCPYLEAGIEAFGVDRMAMGKRHLREAFAGELPELVQNLPKRGFSLPLDAWFRGDLPALDVLAEPQSRERPHLRPGGLIRAIDQHRGDRADLGHALYLLYAYELHLRTGKVRSFGSGRIPTATSAT
jgi:asparagine synthase (glutamine-hydrolysing)